MGSVVISVDAELGWGFHDLAPPTDRLAEARVGWQRLAGLCSEYDIPATWAVVGHLLLTDCDGRHADHPRGPEWFRCEREAWADRPSLRYGPHLVADVASDPVGHEIGCHTFSHVLCATEPRELVEHELETLIALHERLGEPVRSIVPPRHSRPPNDLLRDHGIRVARYAIPTDGGGRVSRFRELTVGPHPLWDTAVVDGVVETYCTTYPSLTASSLPSGRTPAPRLFRALPLEVRKRVHQYYLRRSTERAIATGGSLHLWCHLYDLSNEHQWAVVSEYLEYLGSLPKDTLEIRTMSALAESAETAARVP